MCLWCCWKDLANVCIQNVGNIYFKMISAAEN
jgi:hypothetical protein